MRRARGAVYGSGAARRPAHDRRRGALRLPLALAAGLLVVALGLAGCTSGRSELGTSSGDCYLALPAATAAVHARGHLDGVRLETVAALRVRAPKLYAAARSAHPAVQRVCLVAYTGRFRSAQVARPIGRASGRLAVVELAYPSDRVVATLVVRHPPLPFGHGHIGFF